MDNCFDQAVLKGIMGFPDRCYKLGDYFYTVLAASAVGVGVMALQISGTEFYLLIVTVIGHTPKASPHNDQNNAESNHRQL